MEGENPDGTQVGGSVFHGVIGLYIEQDGRLVEATTACREFIGQSRWLLEHVKASSRDRVGGWEGCAS